MIKWYCLEGEDMALLFTLGTGIFMILGMVIVFLTKNNKKIIDFSIGIAFSVMSMLIVMELFPEAMEKMSEAFSFPKNILFIFGFILLGILLLKVLDLFIPDHDINDKETTILENLFHIGVVASVALVLHNIIEGMAIYSTVKTDLSMGFLIMTGVGLHNIPMGMVLTSTLYQANLNRKKTILFVSLVALSTMLGGIIMLFLNHFITNFVLAILLSITLGMLFYILVFELLEEMRHSQSKMTSIGILLGFFVFFLTRFFE